jgi:hypothetical protein
VKGDSQQTSHHSNYQQLEFHQMILQSHGMDQGMSPHDCISVARLVA